VTVCTSKNQLKNKDFFKNWITNDSLNYLAKFVQQHLKKNISMHQKVQKNLFFSDVITKVENFDKMSYFIEREPDQNPQWRG
jgi:hypothetical protein